MTQMAKDAASVAPDRHRIPAAEVRYEKAAVATEARYQKAAAEARYK